MMGFGKPQLRAKFEVAGFICYWNIRDLFLNDKFAFLSHLLGELGVMYFIYSLLKSV